MKPLNEAYITELMNKVSPADGEHARVIAIAVPTRAFRIVLVDEKETIFRVEQLVRQAGDKWVVLATCHDIIPWRSYHEALEFMVKANQKFLLEMRKIKVERNQLQRELDTTGKLINVK